MNRRVDASANRIDLGNLNTKVNIVATDLTNVPTPLPDQLPSLNYFENFGIAALPELPKKLFVEFFINHLTTPQIQKIYDFTLFGLLGRTYPKVQLTQDLLFEELQNRICHSDYEIDRQSNYF